MYTASAVEQSCSHSSNQLVCNWEYIAVQAIANMLSCNIHILSTLTDDWTYITPFATSEAVYTLYVGLLSECNYVIMQQSDTPENLRFSSNKF